MQGNSLQATPSLHHSIWMRFLLRRVLEIARSVGNWACGSAPIRKHDLRKDEFENILKTGSVAVWQDGEVDRVVGDIERHRIIVRSCRSTSHSCFEVLCTARLNSSLVPIPHLPHHAFYPNLISNQIQLILYLTLSNLITFLFWQPTPYLTQLSISPSANTAPPSQWSDYHTTL